LFFVLLFFILFFVEEKEKKRNRGSEEVFYFSFQGSSAKRKPKTSLQRGKKDTPIFFSFKLFLVLFEANNKSQYEKQEPTILVFLFFPSLSLSLHFFFFFRMLALSFYRGNVKSFVFDGPR